MRGIEIKLQKIAQSLKDVVIEAFEGINIECLISHHLAAKSKTT